MPAKAGNKHTIRQVCVVEVSQFKEGFRMVNCNMAQLKGTMVWQVSGLVATSPNISRPSATTAGTLRVATIRSCSHRILMLGPSTKFAV